MRIKRHRRRTKNSIWTRAVGNAKAIAAQRAFQVCELSPLVAAPALPISQELKDDVSTSSAFGVGFVDISRERAAQ